MIRKLAVLAAMAGSSVVATCPPPIAAQEVSGARVACASEPGARTDCPANTSAGVVLTRSMGTAPCLLGKTWGYDDDNVWVSDGCSAEFLAGRSAARARSGRPRRRKPPAYVPNAGFKLFDGEKGQIYFRLFSYARYLESAKGSIRATPTRFGNSHDVKQPPGHPAQEVLPAVRGLVPDAEVPLLPLRLVVERLAGRAGAGRRCRQHQLQLQSLRHARRRHHEPAAMRSTEGQFPYWLGVDDRMISDEFFRGSYTSGVWLKGEFTTKLKYMAMIGNNLSTLGVSAAQARQQVRHDRRSRSQWLPTTGEFGLYGTFGDYDCARASSRPGSACITRTAPRTSRASRASNDIENSQIRLTDGSVIFTPDLFGARHHGQRGRLRGCRASTAASSTTACRSRPSTTGAHSASFRG